MTCLSEHSRNRGAGVLIGQGMNINEVREKIGMTIESIDNIETAHILAEKYDVEMPILNAVYNVLFNGKLPRDAVMELMTRDLKNED